MKKTKFRNGIRHSKFLHKRACDLRQEGKTHREIMKELGISTGSANLWTKGIVLSVEQKAAIQARRTQKVYTPQLRARLSAWAKVHLVQYRKLYTREELLKKIGDFFMQHHRIPLKRELNMYETYHREFGSWNNAIIAAGFEPNPVLFAKKFIADDGHRCDSFTERIIDNWLFERNIPHERHRRYGDTKMTADFFIKPNIIIEFFGLAGVQQEYDAIIERKRNFCSEHYIYLVELYPEDIFPDKDLSEIEEKLEILMS